MKASVIIPAYNEERSIAKLIRRVPKGLEVIVVDDGSGDGTARVAASLCRCIRLGRNAGKASACMAGAAAARNENIVFMDADMQLNPAEIPRFVKALQGSDIAIGRRDMKAVPWQRRISNAFARKMIKMAAGMHFNDAVCGFRAAKRKKLLMLGLKKKRYEFESEMLLRAAKLRMKIAEVPVSVRYHGSGMPVRESVKVALFLIREALR